MNTLRLTRNPAVLLALFVAAGAITSVATQANADTWRGTAPFCAGKCLPGETQLSVSDSGNGAHCVTGHKVLCKNSEQLCIPRQTIMKCYALVEICDNGFFETPTQNWHSCGKFGCGMCVGSSPTGSSSQAIESSIGSSKQAIHISAELARFAAIWEKRPKIAWVARHGMTSSQYQEEFTKFTRAGYRLVNISGYDIDGQDYYAAVWEMRSGAPWVARHGMTSAQYQDEFTKLSGKGYRLVDISGYNAGGQDRYAAIWEKRTGTPWLARHGMTSAQYQEEFNKLGAQGYRLVRISGYDIAGQDHYAAIWEKGTGSAWLARHGMTSAQYQEEFNKLGAQGYRLVRISGWEVAGTNHYAAIWEKRAGSASVVRHGMTSDQYQKEFTKLIQSGYQLTLISGYHTANH